jgi:alanyl-tRNA synthetase
LGQANISVIKKAELKDRLATIRKSFEKQLKDIENAANKKVRRLMHAFWHLTACIGS